MHLRRSHRWRFVVVVVVLFAAAPAGNASPSAPSDGWLAFKRYNPVDGGPLNGLWLMHPDGTGLHRIIPRMDPVGRPSWSSDGKTILFRNTVLDDDLYVVRVDGSRLHRLRHVEGDISDPEWSPDDSQVVFTNDRGAGPQVWVLDVESGDIHPLTALQDARIGSYSWTPDGSSLVMHLSFDGGGTYVVVLSLGDGSIRYVTRTGRSFGPDLSADGSTIAYVEWDRRTGRHLTLVPLLGGPPKRVASSRGIYGVAWSPDGEWIAFTKDSGGVWMVRPDGSGLHRLPRDILVGELAWQPA